LHLAALRHAVDPAFLIEHPVCITGVTLLSARAGKSARKQKDRREAGLRYEYEI
jgi:hypothetical protein